MTTKKKTAKKTTTKVTKVTASQITTALSKYATSREAAVDMLKEAITSGWTYQEVIKVAVKAKIWSKPRCYSLVRPLWIEAGNTKSPRGAKPKGSKNLTRKVKIAVFAKGLGGNGWKTAQKLLTEALAYAKEQAKKK